MSNETWIQSIEQGDSDGDDNDPDFQSCDAGSDEAEAEDDAIPSDMSGSNGGDGDANNDGGRPRNRGASTGSTTIGILVCHVDFCLPCASDRTHPSYRSIVLSDERQWTDFRKCWVEGFFAVKYCSFGG